MCSKTQIIIIIDFDRILFTDLLSKLFLYGNYRNAKNQIIFPQQELIKFFPYR